MKSLKENKHSVTIKLTKYKNNKLNVATSTQKPDLNITCQKQTYHVYKSLLIQQCPYFSLMLGSNNFQEATNTTIDIKYDGDIFSLILEYIQTGEINLTSDNLEDICRAAIYFMLDDLKLFCCHLFKQQLNCQTVNYFHAFGNEYGVMELSKAALEFKENNFEKILESGVFLEWTMMFILQLLCSNLIRISSERKMLRFVLDWLRFPGFSERIKENAYEVLSKLRFSYLTKRNLDEVTDEMLAQILTQVSTEFSRKITPPRIYHEGIYSLEFGSNPRFTRYCPTDCTITSLQSPCTVRNYVNKLLHCSGKIYLIHSVSLNESRRDNFAYLQLQVYDPFSDTWILLAPPTFAAFDFKLCSVGRCIYVFVSQTWDDLRYITDIFMYCTDTDTWNTVPTEFPTELRSIHSVIACNGDIYIFLHYTNDVIFTPSTGEWSEYICEVRYPSQYGIISYKSKLIFIEKHPFARGDIIVYDTSTKEYKRYPCPNDIDTRFDPDSSDTYFTVYNGSIYFINDYLNIHGGEGIDKLDVDFMDGVSPIQLQRGWNTELNIFGNLVSLDF